jgi:hypothetical protein
MAKIIAGLPNIKKTQKTADNIGFVVKKRKLKQENTLFQKRAHPYRRYWITVGNWS